MEHIFEIGINISDEAIKEAAINQVANKIYKEVNRVLLRENLDLRDTLEENDMLDANNLHNLKDLFSPFGETTTRDEEDEEDE